MEWEIKPFGKESSFSGNPFQDGEEINCYLIRNKEGTLIRADLRNDDMENMGCRNTHPWSMDTSFRIQS